jgi:hypothetical protein
MSSISHQQMAGQVIENYDGQCVAQPQRAEVQQVGQVQTPCMACTSIQLALKDRSPYDRMYLRSYNRLPAHYPTNLEALVFAP